jgi:ArsR family transcriptional regulator, lead/cadmium/zinc/bismuth-responsive transcriptional repressor
MPTLNPPAPHVQPRASARRTAAVPDCANDPHHGHAAALAPPAWTTAQLTAAADLCDAMSDPARLRLLLWLAQREMCVSELVECDESRLGSVSARLQRLHAANLVSRRREAKHVYYALADAHVRDLLHNLLGHAAETR